MTSAPQSIAIMRNIVDRSDFPGTAIDSIAFKIFAGFTGFAIVHEGVPTVVYARTDSADPFVFVSTCIRLDIPDVSRAMRWANDKNRASQSGRYYCVLDRDERIAALLSEASIPGPLVSVLEEWDVSSLGFRAALPYAASALRYTAGSAASNPDASTLGGRVPPADDEFIAQLLMMTAGA